MLIESQAADRAIETVVQNRETIRARRQHLARRAAELVAFLAVFVQFGLIVLVVNEWQIESQSLVRLMQLALVGFVIHHWLPSRFRLPFFGALSLVATVLIVGQMGSSMWIGSLTGRLPLRELVAHLIPGLTLVAIGLGLIGICHLPVRFALRVTLLAMVGAGLALMRAHSNWLPAIGEMWVILGSMFAFRLMVYLYDLKHRTAPFSLASAISFFFLLPNCCFPLFPVVDYKTFCTTYYNEEPIRIYQSGLRWMIRGVIQLLLYRIIYQFAPLDISQLTSSMDVLGFVLGTYLLYLRISGTFHLVVGLLCMFGFNLPETHHRYLLASSFTDFWRRINIYWKDFVMKLFFYPTHFALRKRGTLFAIAVATLATFFATWLLHSWQWFWIRGSFLFTWQDTCFWGILGILVLVNGLYEATLGQRRKLATSHDTARDRIIRGLQTVATFIVICSLWTLWSCHSWNELSTLASISSHAGLRDFAVLLAALFVIGISGVIWGRSSRETSEGKRLIQQQRKEVTSFYPWRSAVAVSAAAVCLLGTPTIVVRLFPESYNLVVRLRHDLLNVQDMVMQRRGYYEELDVGRQNTWDWRKAGMPENWWEGRKLFYRPRSDLLLKEIIPSVSTVLGAAPAKSNHLGMRDREYEKVKALDTYRFVLFGSSHDMGTDVRDNETYENLVEDHLNRQSPNAHYSRYEILNMAVGGDCSLSMLFRLEQIGFKFDPNAVLFSIAATDEDFLLMHLTKVLTTGVDSPPDYREFLQSIQTKARVNGTMRDTIIQQRLRPYISEIQGWVFQRLAQQCRAHGVRPYMLFRPAPIDFDGSEPARRDEMVRLARGAGLEVIDLSSAFSSITDRNALMIAKWDDHTTALGHRLLADKLYEGLVPLLFPASSTQQVSRFQKP